MTCLASAQVCAMRVARVRNCAIVSGPNNGGLTTAIARVQSTPVYTTGEDLEAKNGCGAICASLRTCDSLKRMDLEIELCLRDTSLLELMTGGRLINGAAGPASGFARRAVGLDCSDAVSLEFWTKAIGPSGNCGAAGAQWWRTAYPNATLTLQGMTMANEIATVQLTGYVEVLPNWNLGPFNDWPDPLGLGDQELEAFVIDPAGPPVIPSGLCGYIPVP